MSLDSIDSISSGSGKARSSATSSQKRGGPLFSTSSSSLLAQNLALSSRTLASIESSPTQNRSRDCSDCMLRASVAPESSLASREEPVGF